MSDAVFSARFTPNSSLVVDATTFDVNADIFDGTGAYSGFDVAPGDLVFLDCFPSISNPNTVARYKVLSLSMATAGMVDARLKFYDEGAIVDPGEVAGNPGFICRASAINGLAFHAAPTIHTLPDYVIQYARNVENLRTVDHLLTPLTIKLDGSDVTSEATELNFTGSGVTAVETSPGKIDITVTSGSGTPSEGDPIATLVSTTGYQSVKSIPIPSNSAVSVEMKVVAYQEDGANVAMFKRTGLFYRVGTGSVQVAGQTWLSDQTIKTDSGMDVSYDLGPNSVALMVKNSSADPTKWVGGCSKVSAPGP